LRILLHILGLFGRPFSCFFALVLFYLINSDEIGYAASSRERQALPSKSIKTKTPVDQDDSLEKERKRKKKRMETMPPSPHNHPPEEECQKKHNPNANALFAQRPNNVKQDTR